MPNTTDTEVACTLTWTGGDDWFADGKPKDETLTIPAGKTVERTYRIGPSRQGTPPPVLNIRYEITAEGRTKHIPRKLPLRIVASLTARRVKGITIDGKLDDWSDVPAHLTNTRERVKYKPDAWSGPEDCSMTTRIGYDDKNLYLAVDVTDNVVVGSEGGSQWERDGVMIFWDPRPPNQRGARFTAPCKMVRIWAPDVTIGLQEGTIQGCRMVSRRHKGGYTVELAIPFSAIGKDFKPTVGGKPPISLEVVIYDRDKTATETTMSCMVLSSGTDRAYRTTVGYAAVTFR